LDMGILGWTPRGLREQVLAYQGKRVVPSSLVGRDPSGQRSAAFPSRGQALPDCLAHRDHRAVRKPSVAGPVRAPGAGVLAAGCSRPLARAAPRGAPPSAPAGTRGRGSRASARPSRSSLP
jgi:hypothetical protein